MVVLSEREAGKVRVSQLEGFLTGVLTMGEYKVLIVDDDPGIRDATADLISTTGAKVAQVSNGHLAYDYVARNTPDAVVIDLNMPLMGGVLLVKMLRKSGYPADRMLIYSGSLDEERFHQLAEMDLEHFFVKPVDPNRFLARIRQVFRSVNEQ